MSQSADVRDLDIAVVGVACRVPGAATPDAYWDNLLGGVESITDVDDHTLRARGVPEDLLRDPRYVRRAAILDDHDGFDARFFGLGDLEASLLDPQHRHFLECTWEVLESAGHRPDIFDGRISVFAGSGLHAYFAYHLISNPDLMRRHGLFLVRHTGNDKDFLATRASYELDLKGPSLNIQTACSTSLVAIHLGCQSLLNMESDIALCGGVTIELPHGIGYVAREGEILSPDGRCRAFDADASGTLFGSGVGMVALRRLSDALEDGDPIRAVIRGTAINNDGRAKVGYLAPSVDGQAAVVAEALELAEVDASSISYVEAHGTGTPVGDPIEVAALTQAYRQHTDAIGFCGLGSVKPNIGHLDTAAGVASFLKVVGALERKQLPASLHFRAPNPALSLDASPFRVVASRQPWQSDGPRRAGVNSVGVGGTNAHVILEEAPARAAASPSSGPYWLPLSARSATAAARRCEDLRAWLERHPDADLADVSHTLRRGRVPMPHRCAMLVDDRADALRRLAAPPEPREASSDTRTVWLFAGGGAQHPGMAAELYRSEPSYAAAIDEALRALPSEHAAVVRELLLEASDPASDARLARPANALPALLATQVATARWLIAHGHEPDVVVGHSMGEYTAAHVAGALSLRDAMRLVRTRGELFESLPAGAMTSVGLPADELQARLPHGVSLAADNATSLSLAAGPVAQIEALEAALEADGVECRRIAIDVAAHSSMLDPILEPFRGFVRSIRFESPTTPIISNLTGQREPAETFTDPDYWVRHLREPVRFGAGMQSLLDEGRAVLVEIGPGRVLTSLARVNAAWSDEHTIVTTMRHPRDAAGADRDRLRDALGAVWAAGAEVEAPGDDAGRRRLPLPTYPFEHQRYWIEPGDHAYRGEGTGGSAERSSNDWLYAPAWQPRAIEPLVHETRASAEGTTIVCHDGSPLGDAIVAAHGARRRLVVVTSGPTVARTGRRSWTAPLGNPRAQAELVARLAAAHGPLTGLVDLWTRDGREGLLDVQARAGALLGEGARATWVFVTDGAFALPGDPRPDPEAALLAGAAPVIATELGSVSTCVVDVDRHADDGVAARAVIARLFAPGAAPQAVRGRAVLERAFEPLAATASALPLAEGETIVVTGGHGGMGAALARALAERVPGITIELWSRGGMPPRDVWDTLLAEAPPGDERARRISRVRAVEAAGAIVHSRAVDVGDAVAVRAAIDDIVAHARLRGIVHAAGRLDDGLLTERTAGAIDAVLAPKLDGTKHLQDALLAHPGRVDWLALASSHSAFAGLAGQLDYAAANAALDAFAGDDFGGARVVSIAWPAWSDIGMAADRAAVLRGEGGAVARFGCLGRRVDDAPAVFRRVWDAKADWVLDEHRLVGGTALMPGTGFVALAHAAVLAANDLPDDAEVVLEDVVFEEAFFVRDDATRALELVVDGERWWARSGSGPGETVHARGRWRRSAQALEVDAPPIVGATRETFDGPREDPFVRFGPRWGCVSYADWADDRAQLALAMPDAFEADGVAWPVHPALLDMALGTAQRVSGLDVSTQFLVPIGFEALRFSGRLGQSATSTVWRTTTSSDGVATFDGAVVGPAGRVDATGFAMRALEDAAALPAASLRTPADDGGLRELESALERGIRAEEGAACFLRILGSLTVPQVVVSPRPLVVEEPPTAAIDAATGSAEGTPPATAAERAVGRIWTDVLGVPCNDVHADFFASGGHSLLAIRLVARINDALGSHLPLRAVFEAPTVAALAALAGGDAIDAAAPRVDEPDEPGAPADGVPRVDRSGALPATAAQRALWFVEQMRPGNAALHVCAAFELDGLPDADALDNALTALVTRHETLRTRFEARGGEPFVHFAAPPSSVLQRVAWPAAETAHALVNRLAAAPFDATTGPLYRFVLATREDEAVLLLVLHHLVSDEWSLEIAIEELSARLAGDTPPGEAAGDLQFADVAAAYDARWTPEALEAAVQERRESLLGAPTALDLPTDRPRPPVISTAGARHIHAYEPATAAAARTFARDTGQSLFVVLMAAWQAFVARWAGTDDVLVATPTSLRDRSDVEHLIGFFIHTVVLRAEVDDRPSFRQLVDRTRADLLAAVDRDVPLDALVRALDVPRDPSRNPLFQTMFALFPVGRELRIPGVKATSLDVDAGGAQLDLTLYMADDGDGLRGIAEFATDVFDRETIEAVQRRFDRFLADLLATPDAPVDAAAWLPDSEREAVLRSAAGPTPAIPKRPLAQAAFERLARRQPDAVAVAPATGDGPALAYGALDERANQVARALSERGVREGDAVGVCAARTPELVIWLLAAWKTGAAYVPMDPSFPAERLALMAEDAGAAFVLVDEVGERALAGTSAVRLATSTLAAEADAQPTSRPRLTPDGERRAYLIYTSGSTGRPKGVEVPHRAVTNFLDAMARRPGASSADRWLAVTTISFDISVLELFLPLSTGGTVVLADADTASDGDALVDAIARHEITAMQATPATWRLLLASVRPCPALDGGPDALRALCGGEALPADLARALLPRVRELWNMYGPTETTVWSTCTQVESAEDITIGTPIEHTTVVVLDELGRPQPFGVPGRLFLGGRGVTLGYRGRPTLTAERFVDDPFFGGIMYDTGDRVLMRRDGHLVFASRADHQIKIRGYRIEPGEIEAVLARYEGVREVVVHPWRVSDLDVRLVAWIVPAGSYDEAAAREHLRQSVPEYMVPAHWELLDALPLTPNRKVDRKALPAPAALGERVDVAAPSTPTERWLASVWASALSVPRVGAHDNFFDLGGHSLLAMQVIHAVEERTGYRTNPLEMSVQTLAQLAASLPPVDEAPDDGARPADAGPREPQSEASGQHGTSPLRQLWRRLRGTR